ncbi:MAG: hypothetical protein U0930_01580 [Pirellulales bacterium]
MRCIEGTGWRLQGENSQIESPLKLYRFSAGAGSVESCAAAC